MSVFVKFFQKEDLDIRACMASVRCASSVFLASSDQGPSATSFISSPSISASTAGCELHLATTAAANLPWVSAEGAEATKRAVDCRSRMCE